LFTYFFINLLETSLTALFIFLIISVLTSSLKVFFDTQLLQSYVVFEAPDDLILKACKEARDKVFQLTMRQDLRATPLVCAVSYKNYIAFEPFQSQHYKQK